ncbi:MAG: transglutaminase family protein [Dokdonella sp.]
MNTATPRIRYEVTHATRYRYEDSVSRSQQLLHLTPRVHPRQQCLDHAIEIEPTPARRFDRSDSFGNPVSVLEFDRPHRALAITSKMLIEVSPQPLLDLLSSPRWSDVVDGFGYRAARVLDAATLDASRYRFESPFVRIKSPFADYARDCFVPGRPLLAAAQALLEKIHREFTFDADATHIATPLLDVLANKRGVCQDYAHLMLACLRSLGLSARYVSGYLLTRPPPGRLRLVGADASHAWISLYCPTLGWVDFDPTNKMRPDTEHITIAWGRDFGDVSPQRGAILGSGAHELEVKVTVTPAGALQNASTG